MTRISGISVEFKGFTKYALQSKVKGTVDKKKHCSKKYWLNRSSFEPSSLHVAHIPDC